jgi:hypothetical protein
MLLHQIHSGGSKGWTLLHWGIDPLRKERATDLMTGRTAFAFTLMLNDMHVLGRQIDDLAANQAQWGMRLQIGLTVFTGEHRVNHDLIGISTQKERVAFMARLPSRFLATALAQALGLTGKAIRGGRQMTSAARFGKLVLHLLELSRKIAHQRSQCGVLFSEKIIFFSKNSEFFLDVLVVICHHVSTVPSTCPA